MEVGSIVKVTMEKVLKKGLELDNKEYFCEILSYDEESQMLHLGCERKVLTELSLDARYRCLCEEDEYEVYCLGLIRERFENEEGSVVQFFIENGFYKIFKGK